MVKSRQQDGKPQIPPPQNKFDHRSIRSTGRQLKRLVHGHNCGAETRHLLA